MKLKIRKLEKFDLEERVHVLNSRYIYEYMNIDLPISLSETLKWYENNAFNKNRYDFTFLWDNEICGFGGLTSYDSKNKISELYILIKKDFHGKGFGTLFTQWLCNFGFTELNLHKIYLETLENNSSAKNIYLNNGFNHEGILKMHQFHHGKYMDKYLFGLLKEDWLKLNWKIESPITFDINV